MTLFPWRWPLVALASALFFLCSCAPIPRDAPKPLSFSQVQSTSSFLQQRAQEKLENTGKGQNLYAPLHDGNEGLGARLRLIERAEVSLDLQYFEMKKDLAGSLMTSALLDAADRGVRVRLLLDDLFTQVSDDGFALMDTHPNIDVRLFNPAARPGPKPASLVTDFRRINRRMHNKSFTADGVVAIMGGRNLADEYYQIDASSEFADFELIVLGPVVSDIGAAFDRYWNDGWSVPLRTISKPPSEEVLRQAQAKLDANVVSGRSQYSKALNDPYLLRLQRGGEEEFTSVAKLIADSPNKLKVPVREGERVVAEDVLGQIKAAQKEVVVITPYFVPEDYGARLFSELAERGVTVKIITNSIRSTNHVYVHQGYQRHRKALLSSGVELFELRADALQVLGTVPKESDKRVTMHTKLSIIDGRQVFVGSMNMDPRSIKLNTELGINFENGAFAAYLLKAIDAGLSKYTYRLSLAEDGTIAWHYENPEAPSVQFTEPGKRLSDQVLMSMVRLLGLEPQL